MCSLGNQSSYVSGTRINSKPALMVSSEVTQPDVVTLLSKSEAWSSVVRSSEEPGAVVGKWIESQVERVPGCRAAHHAVLHVFLVPIGALGADVEALPASLPEARHVHDLRPEAAPTELQSRVSCCIAKTLTTTTRTGLSRCSTTPERTEMVPPGSDPATIHAPGKNCARKSCLALSHWRRLA